MVVGRLVAAEMDFGRREGSDSLGQTYRNLLLVDLKIKDRKVEDRKMG